MERIFNEIEKHFKPPPGIRRFMQVIREGGCPPHKTAQSPFTNATRFSFTAGYNSNANYGPENNRFLLSDREIVLKLDDSLASRSDSFYLVELDKQQVLADPNQTVGAFARLRQYSRLTEFNEEIIAAWFRHNSKIYEKESATTLSYAHSNLGGSSYADHFQVASSVGGKNLRFENLLQRNNYTNRSEYNALIAQTGFAFQPQTDRFLWLARAGLRFDFANNDRPGGDRQGMWTQLSTNFSIFGGMILKLQAGLEQMNSEKIYAPGIFDVKRRHRVSSIESSLVIPYQHNSYWRLQLTKRTEKDAVPMLNFEQLIIGVEFNRLWQ